MSSPTQNFYLIFSAILLVLGIYFVYHSQCHPYEGFDVAETVECPNLLIQEGNKIYLYNTLKAQIPGVNPIQFNSLEEYTEFMEWQKSQNIKCPVLYLQHSFDTQGSDVYKMRPNINDPQGGLNPGHAVQPQSLNPYNDPHAMNPSLLTEANHTPGSMPAYDGTSQYVGTTTPLDKMNHYDGSLLYSANAMDDNWGGPSYSSFLIEQGDFSGNIV